jgi:hypothetical protein
MSEHSQSLARRRLALQLRCAEQRAQFAQQTDELREGFSFANRGLDKVRGMRIMPMLMAATSAAGLVSRLGGIFRVAGRAWFIINTLRRLRRSPQKEAPTEAIDSARSRRARLRPTRR